MSENNLENENESKKITINRDTGELIIKVAPAQVLIVLLTLSCICGVIFLGLVSGIPFAF